METFLWILIFCLTFYYGIYGLVFSQIYHAWFFVGAPQDHHKKDHKSWFERNDLFFIFYAVVSASFVILWGEFNFWPGLPIGIGILLMV